ncbi:MAG TPA: ribonuclease P protein component [Victivallales bacterium]|mgnify:CR=1 FL=1|nr:ribonuclease P protein component [Victivallales bacterium]HRR05709.1 ribonuclease P protein component [Victivallales bacterium]HRU00741.1 ribonuclease P protein component [Victivallales bacterium]
MPSLNNRKDELKGFGSHLTLKKESLLRSEKDFDYVKANGKKFSGRYLIVLIAESRSGRLKSGFICSKKFSSKAVIRNRAKRIMKEVFRNTKATISPCEVILIPKQALLTANLLEVQEELIVHFKEARKWNIL